MRLGAVSHVVTASLRGLVPEPLPPNRPGYDIYDYGAAAGLAAGGVTAATLGICAAKGAPLLLDLSSTEGGVLGVLVAACVYGAVVAVGRLCTRRRVE
jgi:hypothetical protein